MHKPNYTNQFRKDIKRLQKRGLDMNQIKGVMSTLINAKPLESKHKNHALKGNLKGYSECHVAPDWLLIYYVEGNTITFTRTGTHADLF